MKSPKTTHCMLLCFTALNAISALDCDFAISFSNNEAGEVFRQNLVVGTDDVHFMNRENSWIMRLANDGTLLHSMKITHETANVQLIGIAP